jgi:hypothetical protein
MAASHPNAAISDTFADASIGCSASLQGWLLTIRADLSTWQVVREQ